MREKIQLIMQYVLSHKLLLALEVYCIQGEGVIVLVLG